MFGTTICGLDCRRSPRLMVRSRTEIRPIQGRARDGDCGTKRYSGRALGPEWGVKIRPSLQSRIACVCPRPPSPFLLECLLGKTSVPTGAIAVVMESHYLADSPAVFIGKWLNKPASRLE